MNQKRTVLFVDVRMTSFGDGTKDKPFGSLQEARERIIELGKQDSDQEIVISLREGVYFLGQTFSLSKDDFGKCCPKITIKGYEDEKVIISGGIPIPWESFSRVSEKEELEKLNRNFAKFIYYADLKGTKVAKQLYTELDLIPQDTRADGQPNVTDLANITVKKNFNLLVDHGVCLSLAGYPKKGYCHMEEILEKGLTTRYKKPGDKSPSFSMEHPVGGRFLLYEKPDLSLWREELKRTGEVFTEGHFHVNWYTDDNYLATIHEDDSMTLLKPSRYGVEQIEEIPNRIRFLNLLCELTEPGEWYFDKETERLYMIPIPLDEGQTHALRVPIRMESLMEFRGLSNLTIENLTIEDTSCALVRILDGHDNKVAGCTLKNSSEYAVSIEGGQRNGILSCDIYDVNQAVYINGGDYKTLTRCDNYMRNNHIFNCWIRGYGMCNIQGVGLLVQHNLFHDMNGALSLKTADALVEKNEFYNIGFELGDFNCVYFGVDFYIQGNVVRHNFVHHMMRYKGVRHLGAMRCDGEGMGITFTGNVFYKAGAYGVATHGALNTITNNIAIETPSVWYTQIIGPKGVEDRWNVVKASRRNEIFPGDTGDLIYRMEQVIGEKGWEKTPWIERFPLLKEVIDTNPWVQLYNDISKNYMTDLLRSGFEFHGVGINHLPETMTIEFPKKISMDVFKDPEHLNFELKSDVVCMEGFEEIPFKEIGLYKDSYRLCPPDKDSYRLKVHQKYRGIQSNEEMNYNPDTAMEMYPDSKCM